MFLLRVQGLSFFVAWGFRVKGLRGLESRGLGFRVYRVLGLGFKGVFCLGFRAWGLEVWFRV